MIANHHSSRGFLRALLLIALAGSLSQAGADELRSQMEANNARWLDAFNEGDVDTLRSMYTQDAKLVARGGKPIEGAEAIARWWQGAIEAGVGEHDWQIIETRQDGNMAYQLAEWTAVRTADGGKAALVGNTVRVLEKQPDGHWLTRVHMYSLHDQ